MSVCAQAKRRRRMAKLDKRYGKSDSLIAARRMAHALAKAAQIKLRSARRK